MGKSLTKVIYKPDPQSTDEFIAIVNSAEVRFLLVPISLTYSKLARYTVCEMESRR
jgi:hypothetical protein